MARKNSTSRVAIQRSGRWSESRPVARTAPSAMENTEAKAKARSVLPSPRSSSSWMPLYSNGDHFAEVNWSVSKRR